MAEAHPVGFRWVMKAKERGATIIHVDPSFSRTSALADIWVPIRAGGDIAFLGGLVRHIDREQSFLPRLRRSLHECLLHSARRFSRHGRSGDRLFLRLERGEARLRQGELALRRRRDLSFPQRDLTLQHPRCVFQTLRRHFCSLHAGDGGERSAAFRLRFFTKLRTRSSAASGPDKTAAICYALGWTQHSKGVQIIRTAAILQLLLGNIGRPGGGILALRGHASIQGSTDIPTLYDILPGYLPMPRGDGTKRRLRDYLAHQTKADRALAQLPGYFISLLKAYYGKNATARKRFRLRLGPEDHRQPFVLRISLRHGRRKNGRHVLDGPEPGGRRGQLAVPAKSALEIKMAGRARHGRDRSGHISGANRPRSSAAN